MRRLTTCADIKVILYVRVVEVDPAVLEELEVGVPGVCHPVGHARVLRVEGGLLQLLQRLQGLPRQDGAGLGGDIHT